MLLNGRYLCEKVIGQGGMGKVYLAFDQKMECRVAIKDCIPNHNNPNSVRRIQREYYFMCKLQHRNLVSAMDFFIVQNRYFIVMEYVEGITLEDLIRQHKQAISFSQQMSIIKQICDAVEELHNNGIVHRDLKPSNIILQRGSLIPKIMDFGIAKSMNQDLVSITNIDTIMGTPGYMAPEQTDGNVKEDPRTDVFALGTIFYQFLGWQDRSPFYTGNIISSMDKIVNFHPPLLSITQQQAQHLPHVLEKAMDKNLQNRIFSVAQMRTMLFQQPQDMNTQHRNLAHIPITLRVTNNVQ